MADSRSDRQVFYDPHQRRWWRWRQVFILMASILALLITVFLLNVLDKPHLASLDLPYQTRILRAIPESAKAKASVAERRKRRLNRMIARLGNLTKGRKGKESQSDTAINESSALMVAFFVNWDTPSLTAFREQYDKVDVLVPEWLLPGEAGDGSLVIKDDEENALALREFIKHEQIDVKIMPMLINFNGQEWQSQLLAKILASPAARRRMIENVTHYLTQNNYLGVNIDFEDVPPDSQENLRTFMGELSDACHTQKLLVSQDLPAADTNFNYRYYSGVNDFVVLMNYDQHWETSPPGPVASQDWFLGNIRDRLAQVPPNKLVIALANYGYDWTDLGKKRYEATAISFQQAMRTASESDASPEMDPDSLNPTFEYYDEQSRIHKVWFLDGMTIYNQIAETKKFSPRGYALWRLGMEDPSAWQVLNKFETEARIAEKMKFPSYGYDVDYNGEGELLRIEDKPQRGERSYTLDPDLNVITDESFPKIPLGYLIDRYGRQKKKMALSFDDGPDPRYTPQILDILKQYKAPAVFFLVGLAAEENIGLVKRMVEEGHEIGNHSFSHPNMDGSSVRQVEIELNLTQRLFEARLGIQSLYFRPPYSLDTEPETPSQVQLLEAAQALGYLVVGERPDARDWFYVRQPDKILEATFSDASKGNVLLLHDAGGDRTATIEALPQIITELRRRGYEIVPLSSLMGMTRSRVMPPLREADRWRARLDFIAFSMFGALNTVFQWLFIIGIVFGIGRFVFIGTLAIVQEFIRHRERYNDAYTPFVSVIVPARNEEMVIQRTVSTLLSSDYPNFEIIVVDDGSVDQTASRVREAFGDDPRVRLFEQENRGKAEALNFGLAQSKSEIVIALDADTLFRADTMRKLVRRFEVKNLGAVAGNAKVGNRVNMITRWQALEYITSQNLDRRAFDALNCITVVPGAVGAWRRDLILNAGGFTGDTLAEDTDLTISIRRMGYDIAYEDKAIAFTEAPDKLGSFLKQRFRWTFGTLQSVWKHRHTFFRPRYGSLGFIALPNIVVFQLLFPLIAPLMDLLVLLSVGIYQLQRYYHGNSYSSSNILRLAGYYAMFLVVDYLACILAFVLERTEDWTLLLWLVWQRLLYRQVMYYVAIKSLLAAIRGKAVGWVRVERKATVAFQEPGPK
jgi:cellulose synthase/poly-beta-1,6-N-acetylglucosamine synthase-like glycosyltransferase/spore germination protein YaaH/peptidoglycan/xylan/chitin deacetylase (PgdA/CDA1 family)